MLICVVGTACKVTEFEERLNYSFLVFREEGMKRIICGCRLSQGGSEIYI